MIKKFNNCFYDFLKSNITEFSVDYLEGTNPYLVNYVYVIDDCPIGLISYSVIYDRIELEYLWVKNEFRNNGIASLLLDHMFKIDNIINITLEVCVSNVSAISLYKKNGFEIASVRKNYYDGKDAYLMIREMM